MTNFQDIDARTHNCPQTNIQRGHVFTKGSGIHELSSAQYFFNLEISVKPRSFLSQPNVFEDPEHIFGVMLVELFVPHRVTWGIWRKSAHLFTIDIGFLVATLVLLGAIMCLDINTIFKETFCLLMIMH